MIALVTARTQGSEGGPQAYGKVPQASREAPQAPGKAPQASGRAPQASGKAPQASGGAPQASGEVYQASGKVPQVLEKVLQAPQEASQAQAQVCLVQGEAAEETEQLFVSSGAVALKYDSQEVPVRILRDTGAGQSLLLAGILDLPPPKPGSPTVYLVGLGGDIGPRVLREIYLRSELVTGPVRVVVLGDVARPGIEFILGNDLAGGRVTVTPMVSSVPCVAAGTDDLAEEFPEAFPVCVVTRAQAKTRANSAAREVEAPVGNLGTAFMAHLKETQADPSVSQEALKMAQRADPEVAGLFILAEEPVGEAVQTEGFYLRGGILMRCWRPPKEPAEDWNVRQQVVLPREYREEVLKMGHAGPVAGHSGIARTLEKIGRHFWWPGLRKDVREFCRSCEPCQRAGKAQHMPPPVPLQPLPTFPVPFSRVMIDCVGPLPKTKKQNEYLLTILDMTTRFPEAVPLRNIRAKTIVEALIQFFTRYGLPREVQSDQGSNFTSTVFRDVMRELGVKQIMSSAYHPQSQGAIERFHRSLKEMVRTYCGQFPSEWDVAMPFLMFAARDSVNESTGFTPFQLVYSHEVRGPLSMMKERLVGGGDAGDPLEYAARFTDRMQVACEVAQENLAGSKTSMKRHYDKRAKQRRFAAGDRVLVLLPAGGVTLGVRFEGPYTVVKAAGPCTYVISTPGRRLKTRLCHVNLLKPYVGREAVTPVPVCLAVVHGVEQDPAEEEEAGYTPREPITVRLRNTEALQGLRSQLSHLTEPQVEDVLGVVHAYPGLFRDAPGRTTLMVHDVDTGEAPPIKQHPYRVSAPKHALIQQEVDYMREIGVIEHTVSEWSSPVVLVGKEGGAHRLCIDYRKVNAVTRTDAYPIPRIEDCIDQVGRAQYVSKFDMLKGYWQVPLSDHAKGVSAFATRDALYACQVLPFGMKNAPACFQRLMNQITSGLNNVVTYIDDVVVYSDTWESHTEHIRALFASLAEASLVVNLPKCDFGRGQVIYLGHRIGRGKVLPRQAKVEAILQFPVPGNRRQLMRILGMCGFYRRFVENFSSVTAPLTNLLRKGVKWVLSQECLRALDAVKAILSSEPVLVAPDFFKPFCLAVDASDVGVGGVLLQAGSDGFERPVAYFSKKLDRHQRNYSTIEKEALALVLAVQHFEVYVSSVVGDVTVYSDHNPLTFLAKFQKSNARVFRWSLVLQPYGLKVQHVPGRDNVIADALSRSTL